MCRLVPRAVELLGNLAAATRDEVAYLTAFAKGPTLQPPLER
ncbi:hypothetical protein [Sphaerisporangium album]|nr:hypothetical protein [Sphaerisporangium album]